MANNVRIDVTANAQGAVSQLNQVGGAFGGINLKAAAAGAAVAAVGAAVFKLANDSANLAQSYDKGFRRVETLFARNREEIAHAEQGVRDLARTYGLDLNNAIEATYQALSAGVPAGNVLEFLEEGARASVGGVFELTAAVDVLTSIINAYGMEADQAGRVSDVLFATVRLGKTDMEQLSRSIF